MNARSLRIAGNTPGAVDTAHRGPLPHARISAGFSMGERFNRNGPEGKETTMTVQTATIEATEENETLANRIRAARDAKGISRTALAGLINVSAKTIEKWETGERHPPVKRLEDLAEHLDVPDAIDALQHVDQLKRGIV